MCHSRTLNSKRNKLHERVFRLAYDDRQSTFTELLIKGKSVTIHLRLAPGIMKDIFRIANVIYDFKNDSLFTATNVNYGQYGSETKSFQSPKIRSLLLKNIKLSDNVNISSQMLSFAFLGTVHGVCSKFL